MPCISVARQPFERSGRWPNFRPACAFCFPKRKGGCPTLRLLKGGRRCCWYATALSCRATKVLKCDQCGSHPSQKNREGWGNRFVFSVNEDLGHPPSVLSPSKSDTAESSKKYIPPRHTPLIKSRKIIIDFLIVRGRGFSYLFRRQRTRLVP